MPQVSVVFYQDDDGSVPALEWLREIKQRDGRITAKFHERILELKEQGWELTRPAADILRDGIYELRVGHNGINYRIVYFFHGNVAAVVSHGFTKERVVPAVEIQRAIRRKIMFTANPAAHTQELPIDE